MGDFTFVKNPHRKYLERVNNVTIKKLLKENNNPKYINIHGNICISSSSAGYLLGEMISEHINVESFIYLTKTSDNLIVIVIVNDGQIIFDTISSVDDWRLELAAAVDPLVNYQCFCHAELHDTFKLIFKNCGEVTMLNDGDFEQLTPKLKLITVKKYFSTSGGSLKYAIILGGAVVVGSYFMLFGQEEKKPEDPFANYRREVAVSLASDGLDQTVDALTDITSSLKTWVISNSDTYNNLITVTLKPLTSSSKLEELKKYSELRGYIIEPVNGGAVVKIPLKSSSFNSSKIYPLFDLSVKVYDTIIGNTLFDVGYNSLTQKVNYSSLNANISGEAISIPEIKFLSQLFRGWPVFIDKISFTSDKDDADFMYDADIKLRLVGGN